MTAGMNENLALHGQTLAASQVPSKAVLDFQQFPDNSDARTKGQT